jgi:hypothetical protein
MPSWHEMDPFFDLGTVILISSLMMAQMMKWKKLAAAYGSLATIMAQCDASGPEWWSKSSRLISCPARTGVIGSYVSMGLIVIYKDGGFLRIVIPHMYEQILILDSSVSHTFACMAVRFLFWGNIHMIGLDGGLPLTSLWAASAKSSCVNWVNEDSLSWKAFFWICSTTDLHTSHFYMIPKTWNMKWKSL